MSFRWKPYVPVSQRRRQAALELRKLAQKGRRADPVIIEGRTIAHTVWGKAWCDNLERYSDFANRLPRGRTYVRNGSVVDLVIGPGKVTARVSGSRLYEVEIKLPPLAKSRWKTLCRDCAGAVDSVVELLQGRLARSVMERLCHPQTGLFPSPGEFSCTCTCPDWAMMCKHVAAALYGVGSRLDREPGLLFGLRHVDEKELIAQAGHALALPRAQPATGRVLANEGLSGIFGLDLVLSRNKTTPRVRKKSAPSAKKKLKRAP